MLEPPDDAPELEAEEDAPKLFAAWVAVRQAEVMYRHFASAPADFPENAIYVHSCVTALRAVTNLMQKALRHEPGFNEWYEGPGGIQETLRADAELRYLYAARTYVLKRDVLQLTWSGQIRMDGDSPPGTRIRGLSPEGPIVEVPDPNAPGGFRAVDDWREVPGVEFDLFVRAGRIDGLPEPPERELREVLKGAVISMHELVAEAERRFDPSALEED